MLRIKVLTLAHLPRSRSFWDTVKKATAQDLKVTWKDKDDAVLNV